MVKECSPIDKTLLIGSDPLVADAQRASRGRMDPTFALIAYNLNPLR